MNPEPLNHADFQVHPGFSRNSLAHFFTHAESAKRIFETCWQPFNKSFTSKGMGSSLRHLA
ncbi:MAG: hypothetical protein PHV34_23345, partial [Verrucomicrobiae bacterium]|nr:hypothetical protein [Verrucomicrobiae bacterium]